MEQDMESSVDSYDMIPKRPKEFLKLIQQPDAARVLQDVGVDVVSWFVQSILGRRNHRIPPVSTDRPDRWVCLTSSRWSFQPSMLNSPSKTSCRCHHLPFSPRGFPRGFPVGNGGFGSTFPHDGYCMFSLMFFLFLIFGMGQIGRSEKYPLNVMKRCVFSKKWQPKCAPAVFNRRSIYTSVRFPKMWFLTCDSVQLAQPPCSTMWRFPPSGLFKCIFCFRMCCRRRLTIFERSILIPFYFFPVLFGSISLQGSLLRNGAAGGAVPSRQQHRHGCSEICSRDEEGCFKRVSQRNHMSKRDAVLQTSTLLGANISPEKSILKMIFLFPRWDMLVPWSVSIQSIDFTFPNCVPWVVGYVSTENHVRWKIWSISGSVSWLHCLPGLPLRVSMRFWWTWRVTSFWGGVKTVDCCLDYSQSRSESPKSSENYRKLFSSRPRCV